MMGDGWSWGPFQEVRKGGEGKGNQGKQQEDAAYRRRERVRKVAREGDIIAENAQRVGKLEQAVRTPQRGKGPDEQPRDEEGHSGAEKASRPIHFLRSRHSARQFISAL